MPKLVAAAIKFKPKGCEYFQIMCGKRHCNVLEMMYNLRIEYEKATVVQGFLTEDDQFVDRYDAAQMAYRSKQILPDSDLLEKMNADPDMLNAYQLFSEDVW